MPAQTPTWEQQSDLALKDLEATARSLQVKLQELRVKVGPTEIDLDGAFKIAAREQLGAIILMPWARFGEEQKRIADLAIARRLPTISGQGYTESGILMSYGAKLSRLVSPGSRLRRQNPKGRQTRRSAGGAADEV
jgi:hypothetical protein